MTIEAINIARKKAEDDIRVAIEKALATFQGEIEGKLAFTLTVDAHSGDSREAFVWHVDISKIDITL